MAMVMETMKPMKRKKRHHNRKTIVVCSVLCVLVAAVLAVFVWQTLERQRSYKVTSGNRVDVGSGYRNVTYKGKKYQYNTLVTTVLYAGLDSMGQLKASTAYGDKARADSIYVVVLDKKAGQMSVLALSRDLMTEIRRYSRTGKSLGNYVTHLGYAYSYGDGGKVSCENLRDAVSELLGGIPIQEYVVSNQSSIADINDLVGGVTVTVPNDDLTGRYPELTEGAEVTLNGDIAYDFLHYRDTETDFSNESRMERQRAYINGYIGLFQKQLKQNPEDTWEKIQKMENYIQTSITRNKYLTLAKLIGQIDFDDSDYYTLKGQDQQGELHDEFFYDEEALQETILELFYEEI